MATSTPAKKDTLPSVPAHKRARLQAFAQNAVRLVELRRELKRLEQVQGIIEPEILALLDAEGKTTRRVAGVQLAIEERIAVRRAEGVSEADVVEALIEADYAGAVRQTYAPSTLKKLVLEGTPGFDELVNVTTERSVVAV